MLPESLDDDIFGRAGIADNPQDPAIHFSFELPEKGFERGLVALYEPLEEVAIQLIRHGCLPSLIQPTRERFRRELLKR